MNHLQRHNFNKHKLIKSKQSRFLSFLFNTTIKHTVAINKCNGVKVKYCFFIIIIFLFLDVTLSRIQPLCCVIQYTKIIAINNLNVCFFILHVSNSGVRSRHIEMLDDRLYNSKSSASFTVSCCCVKNYSHCATH